MLGRNIQLIWKSFAKKSYYFANVPDDLPPPASGTKACFAGDVPKVLKAWELSASVRLPLLFILFHCGQNQALAIHKSRWKDQPFAWRFAFIHVQVKHPFPVVCICNSISNRMHRPRIDSFARINIMRWP